MIDARQAAYLQALGVDVYVPRDAPPLPVVEEPVVDVAAAEPPPSPAVRPAPRPVAPRPVETRPVETPRVETPAAPAVAVTTEPGPAVGELDWEPLREVVAACRRCELHATRTQTVFGVGNRQARWMFIGEAPGQ